MPTISQRSFSAGELSPELHSRVDLQKYFTGLKTCRNMIVSRSGGVFRRPGTEYVGKAKYGSEFGVRLIDFSFNEDQTYVIELGHYYARFIRNGKYVTEQNEGGQTVVIEIETPYRHEYLNDLNYAQSGDVITITHQYYPPMDLKRTDDGWLIEETRTTSSVEAPASVNTKDDDLALNPRGSGVYAVTTVDENGDESFPTIWSNKSGSQRRINNSAQLPLLIEWSAVDSAKFYNVYKRINGNYELLGVVNSGTLLNDIGQETDPTVTPPIDEPVFKTGSLGVFSFSAIDPGRTEVSSRLVGSDDDVRNFFGSLDRGTVATVVFLNLKFVESPEGDRFRWLYEASPYQVALLSKDQNGRWGIDLVGPVPGFERRETSLDKIAIRLSYGGLSTSKSRMYKIGNFPSSVGYYKQRRYYASTINEPGRVFASKIGRYNDFRRRRVISGDDPFNFVIASRDVSPVKQMIGLSDMILFSGTGEFSFGDTVTPSTINVRQQSYHGINDGVRPVLVGRSAFFVQARGSIIRDYLYDFQANGYEGSDLTVFSSHLFDGYDIRDLAYMQSPQSNLWVIRSDGGINCLTFIREQAIIAWSRHDLSGGKAISGVSINEDRSDAVYIVVERGSENLVEKLKNQTIRENKFFNFIDSSVTFDGRNTDRARLRLEPFSISNKTYLIRIDGFEFNRPGKLPVALHVSNPNKNYQIRLRHNGITAKFSSLLGKSDRADEIFVTLDTDEDISSLQGEDIYDWEFLSNLIPDVTHIAGKELSVIADGFVINSPNNPSYPKYIGVAASQTEGRLLDRFYSHIRAGLPMTSDIETLNIDSLNAPAMKKNKKMITSVVLDLIETRGVFVGPRRPLGDTIEGLVELKIRESEGYNDPVRLFTGPKEVNIRPEWNSNGSVFIRQVDPLPMTIAGISPSGYMPSS